MGDLFAVDLASGEIANLTKDEFADYAPAYSPDGKSIVYAAHISGNDKLFQLDLATGQKKQFTFGTHDDTGAKFFDDHTVIFTSTATDPNVPISPEVAKNGNIPNVWSLDLRNGQLKQYTDSATGIVSPVVLRQSSAPKIAFVSYYKGENGIHVIEPTKPIATVASSDFGAPGPVIDFQPPLSHTLLRDNIHKKSAFEKMSMAGRPPVNLGVTSGGTFYGNTELVFTDVLGRQADLVLRPVGLAVPHDGVQLPEHRASDSIRAPGVLAGSRSTTARMPARCTIRCLGPIINSDRQLAEAVQSQRGGSGFVIYPFNRYSRVELSGGFLHLSENYTNQGLQDASIAYQQQSGQPIFRNGNMIPLGISVRAGDDGVPRIRARCRPLAAGVASTRPPR